MARMNENEVVRRHLNEVEATDAFCDPGFGHHLALGAGEELGVGRLTETKVWLMTAAGVHVRVGHGPVAPLTPPNFDCE
jgi:hypothetical protein